MQIHVTALMRLSLWFLLGAASLVAIFWLALVVVSGFEIWLTESNTAGLILQSALILFPVSVFFGIKQSKGNFSRTSAVFALAWTIAAVAMVFFQVW
ncbi:hypothetical protein [Altericroceibacterium xinjiangense]|uniref:hypothetical protein n=1 Tax=Altericroceibacterium xinjiangense TaxID=762261 RepID=UPI000F7DB91F|nr:hypothetical protein [Altericroceibacterium xinjiangense]